MNKIINSATTPSVTIGITVYNAESTIEEAVNSALSQSLGAIEIIVVDDLSTDKSISNIDYLKNNYKKIRVIKNSKNLGVAACRNIIIKEAAGEFIAFFDDDDISLPERLAEQYERINKYQHDYADVSSVICHSARLQKFKGSSQKYIPTMGVKRNKIAPQGLKVAERILYGKPLADGFGSCASCSQMGKTSDYRKLGGFDESLRRSEDTEYNIRFALNGGHFVGISKPLVIQTMTLTSDKNLQTELALTLQYMKKHKDFINERDSYRFCQQWLQIKYLFLLGQYRHFFITLLSGFLNNPIFTLKRILWSLPSLKQNYQFKKFHAQNVEE